MKSISLSLPLPPFHPTLLSLSSFTDSTLDIVGPPQSGGHLLWGIRTPFWGKLLTFKSPGAARCCCPVASRPGHWEKTAQVSHCPPVSYAGVRVMGLQGPLTTTISRS